MSTDSFVPKSTGNSAPRIDRASIGANRPASVAPRAEPNLSFRALLDGLSARANELEAGSQSIERPEDLSGAIERSRDATADAAQLAEGLLEAWRQSRQGPSPVDAAGARRSGRA